MAINRIKTGGITDGTITTTDLAPGTIANDRLANSAITINGTSVSLGGSVTAGTDWQAVTVADGSTTLTAEAGKGYFLDTNTGVIEVFLPASPSRGNEIFLVDYSGTFSTNKVIINTGGKLIDSTTGGGSGSEYELTTNNTVAHLVFVDDDKGWLVLENEAKSSPSAITGSGGGYDTEQYIVATGGTITTVDTNFKVHTFTGDGCFVVSQGAGSVAAVDYLVVAGGGGGGRDNGGGGGAGGMRYTASTFTMPSPAPATPLNANSQIPVVTQTYPVTVGAGGGGGCGPCAAGVGKKGSNSVFSTITSAGGGGGGTDGGSPYSNPSSQTSGGSGGGAGQNSPTGPVHPACSNSGNTPPVSPAQGTDGGRNNGSPAGGGGGGGAVQAGGGCNSSVPGKPGGNGAGFPTGFGSIGESNSCFRYVAGGGAGGTGQPGSGSGGNGGLGNAGDGGNNTAQGCAAQANTGSGGGGGAQGVPDNSSAAGGKGIVVIRYRFQA